MVDKALFGRETGRYFGVCSATCANSPSLAIWRHKEATRTEPINVLIRSQAENKSKAKVETSLVDVGGVM